jgi:ferredoxin-NADP reductase
MPETQSVVSVLLEGPDGAELAPPLPGQFVTLRLVTAAGSSPLIRSYSLSGSPRSRRYCISVKKEGEASSYIAEHLLPGQILDVAAPRGLFVLQPATTPIVFLSAGIGATPVMAMLRSLAEERSRQEIWWLYGTRSSAEHVFAEESRRLLDMLPNAHSYTMYSQPLPADARGSIYDGVGRFSVAVLERLAVPRDATFYLCGPAGFLRDLSAGLIGWGVTPMQLHSEIFGSLPSLTPGLRPTDVSVPHQPPGPPANGPHVSFVRSGVMTRWGNAWSSLLELAEACDVPVRWACRTGVCHSCESGLVDGEVEYAPEPLDAPADGNLLLCCARPLGDVVLDV